MNISLSEKKSIDFKRRYKIKKQLNIIICSLIFILGISSFIFSAFYDMNGDFLSEFRYMTINGTLFTSLLSLIVVILNFIEIRRGIEFSSHILYFTRLSSVVTESIIAIVIAMSFFPFIPDNPNILKFDSFNMHVIIPILSIVSFLINDPPIQNMKPIMRLYGSWPITIYAAVIITLILLGFIPQEHIPYSFLEIKTRPLWYILMFGCIVYGCAYALSWVFSEWNKKLSWLWFHRN